VELLPVTEPEVFYLFREGSFSHRASLIAMEIFKE
jgi:hypothetical protein